MGKTTKLTVILNKLNLMITELNIKISKNDKNDELKKELEKILFDKELLYKGTNEDIEKIIIKYGEGNNE